MLSSMSLSHPGKKYLKIGEVATQSLGITHYRRIKTNAQAAVLYSSEKFKPKLEITEQYLMKTGFFQSLILVFYYRFSLKKSIKKYGGVKNIIFFNHLSLHHHQSKASWTFELTSGQMDTLHPHFTVGEIRLQ